MTNRLIQSYSKYAEHSETIYQNFSAVTDIQKGENGLEILVEWEMLPDDIDRAWEPVTQVHEDVPKLLAAFLDTPENRRLKNKAKTATLATSS